MECCEDRQHLQSLKDAIPVPFMGHQLIHLSAEIFRIQNIADQFMALYQTSRSSRSRPKDMLGVEKDWPRVLEGLKGHWL